MFTLPVRLLWSLSTLQARSRSGSITAVIVLCSSTEAGTSLFWNQLDAFYRLVEQMSRWNTLFSSPRWRWEVMFVETKQLLFPCALDFWASGGRVVSCDRVSQQSSKLVCIRGNCGTSAETPLCLKLAFMEPAGEEQIYFKFQISGGDSVHTSSNNFLRRSSVLI